jgi:hypothetical protein
MLEILVLKKNFHMLEQSLDSLIKTMTGKFPKKNFLKLKLNNWQLTLEVVEKEENEFIQNDKPSIKQLSIK